jgi:hypothetical protein
MRFTLLIAIILFSKIGFSQKTKVEINKDRNTHLKKLKDTVNGILTKEEIGEFNGLDYFNFDSTYQIQAIFKKKKGPKFEMPTSTKRTSIYRRYGILTFNLGDKSLSLEVYQNIKLSKSKNYKHYLFVPFRDKTCGDSSYGGGRYLDMEKQKGKAWLIDFNLAYNPYCAYSYRYSCPIPPKVNTLDAYIKAGEKVLRGH